MTKAFTLAHTFTAEEKGYFNEHCFGSSAFFTDGIPSRWFAQLEEKVRQDFMDTADTCDGSNAWDTHPYEYDSTSPVTAEDIRECTKEQAALLMHKYLWTPLCCEKLPLPLGIVLYDTAAHMGGVQAVLLLQKACHMVGESHLDEFYPLKNDGVCGPKTIALARSLQECGLDFYTARFIVRQRINFYTKLVRKHTDKNVFLLQWKQHCADLLQYLADVEREI